MARGWESKSVESQMEAVAEAANPSHHQQKATNEEKDAQKQRQSLLLSRSYVLSRIKAATNELYIQSLRQALNDIEQRIARLDNKSLS